MENLSEVLNELKFSPKFIKSIEDFKLQPEFDLEVDYIDFVSDKIETYDLHEFQIVENNNKNP